MAGVRLVPLVLMTHPLARVGKGVKGFMTHLLLRSEKRQKKKKRPESGAWVERGSSVFFSHTRGWGSAPAGRERLRQP